MRMNFSIFRTIPMYDSLVRESDAFCDSGAAYIAFLLVIFVVSYRCLSDFEMVVRSVLFLAVHVDLSSIW